MFGQRQVLDRAILLVPPLLQLLDLPLLQLLGNLFPRVPLLDRLGDRIENVAQREPTPILVDRTLDIMSIDVVEQPVDGVRADAVALETRDDVLDERRIVLGHAQQQLTREVHVVLVEVLVEVCPARRPASVLVRLVRGPRVRSLGLRGEVVVRSGVDAHVVCDIDGGCFVAGVGRGTDDVVERG